MKEVCLKMHSNFGQKFERNPEEGAYEDQFPKWDIEFRENGKVVGRSHCQTDKEALATLEECMKIFEEKK